MRLNLDDFDLGEGVSFHMEPLEGKGMFVETEIEEGEVRFSVSPTLQSCLESMRRGRRGWEEEEEVEMEFL